MPPTELLAWICVSVFLLSMVAAAFSDLASFRIPNLIPTVAAIAFVPAALLLGWSLARVGSHVAAGGAMLVLCFALFSRGYIGGGDAKLLAAGSVWTGWTTLPTWIFAVALLGGLFALLMLGLRRLPLPMPLARIGWIARLHAEKRKLPYAVAIACGTLIVAQRLPAIAALLDAPP